MKLVDDFDQFCDGELFTIREVVQKAALGEVDKADPLEKGRERVMSDQC